jgi:colicin import membrane protein
MLSLSALQAYIAQIQCDCDRVWIAEQLRALHDESDDPTYRMQLAELQRFACANPIFGYHHYFAGCADGGGNKAVVRSDVSKMAGMQHEVDLHELEKSDRSDREALDQKADLESKALAAAQKMTPEERQVLSDHLDRIQSQVQRLNADLIHAFEKNPEADMNDPHIRSVAEQLRTRQAEAHMLSTHLSRAQNEENARQGRIAAFAKSMAKDHEAGLKNVQEAKARDAAAAKAKADAVQAKAAKTAALAQARAEREQRRLEEIQMRENVRRAKAQIEIRYAREAVKAARSKLDDAVAKQRPAKSIASAKEKLRQARLQVQILNAKEKNRQSVQMKLDLAEAANKPTRKASSKRAMVADLIQRTMMQANILRFGCTPENVIRGYNGHFAGCAGGGSTGKAVHSQVIHTRGGMKAEIDLRMHERDAKAFVAKNGAAQYKAVHDDLVQQAKAGAAQLTAADKTILQADLKSVLAKAAAIERNGQSATYLRDEALMLQRQLQRAGVTKSAGKATGKQNVPSAPKPAHKTSNIHPSFTVPKYDFDPLAPINPRAVHLMYGTDKFRQALVEETLAGLKTAARSWANAHPADGQPASYSKKSDLVDYLFDRVTKHDGTIASSADVAAAVAKEPVVDAPLPPTSRAIQATLVATRLAHLRTQLDRVK